jgi:hypothetical protein
VAEGYGLQCVSQLTETFWDVITVTAIQIFMDGTAVSLNGISLKSVRFALLNAHEEVWYMFEVDQCYAARIK